MLSKRSGIKKRKNIPGLNYNKPKEQRNVMNHAESGLKELIKFHLCSDSHSTTKSLPSYRNSICLPSRKSGIAGRGTKEIPTSKISPTLLSQ